jgi:selenocysteine lyase/cysteine desulfurase
LLVAVSLSHLKRQGSKYSSRLHALQPLQANVAHDKGLASAHRHAASQQAQAQYKEAEESIKKYVHCLNYSIVRTQN